MWSSPRARGPRAGTRGTAWRSPSSCSGASPARGGAPRGSARCELVAAASSRGHDVGLVGSTSTNAAWSSSSQRATGESCATIGRPVASASRLAMPKDSSSLEVQEHVRAAIQVRHLLARADEPAVATGQQLARERVDLVAQRPVAGHDQEVPGSCATARIPASTFFEAISALTISTTRAAAEAEALAPARPARKRSRSTPLGINAQRQRARLRCLVDAGSRRSGRRTRRSGTRAAACAPASRRSGSRRRAPGAPLAARCAEPVEERVAAREREVEVARAEDACAGSRRSSAPRTRIRRGTAAAAASVRSAPSRAQGTCT